MRIFAAGATGAIGKRLIPALLAAGHEVTGMTRSPERAGELNARGATGVVCDVYDAERVQLLVGKAEPEVVINLLTDLPQVMDASRLAEFYANNDRVRTVGGDNLLGAAIGAGVGRFIVESVAFFYESEPDGLMTEESQLHFAATDFAGAAVRAMDHAEQAVLQRTDLDGTVLRYGYLYGPDTYYATIERAARRVPSGGFYSFVHVDDAAAATIRALDAPPGIYNVVDDTWRTGRRPSVSNEKLTQTTGWAPKHPPLASDWSRE